MKSILLDFARYNLWVNTQLINLFKTVDESLLTQEVVSSFPSIRLTLLHLWDAESLWVSRLNGISPSSFPSKTFEGDNAEVFSNLLAKDEEMLRFVEAQSEEFFSQNITFTILSAKGEFQQLASDMILHCMNHQSFHRGQLITMARQLGITQFPRIDYIIYKRELANQ